APQPFPLSSTTSTLTGRSPRLPPRSKADRDVARRPCQRRAEPNGRRAPGGGGRERRLAATSRISARGPVLCVAAEVDARERLVADDPGVVPRLDHSDVAGPDLRFGAVVVCDLHPAGHAVDEVRRLAFVCPRDRLDVL